MRRATARRAGSAAAAVVAAAAATAAAQDGGTEPSGQGGVAPAPDRLEVHEWGTFTSMQGSDGLALEGLTREEETLPHFVYSRGEVRSCPLRDQGWKGLEVPPAGVTQKMETPVLYFHSTGARRVEVRVDFVQGLLTQWYPVVDLLGPPEGAADAGPLDVSKVERSFLQWEVDVLPAGTPCPPELQAVAAGDPWTFAREVDANWLRTAPRTDPGRAGPVETERYLFYRGLGAFRTGLTAQVGRDGKVALRNSWKGHDLGQVVVMEIRDGRGRMTVSRPIPAGGSATAELHDGEWWGPVDDIEAKLRAYFEDRLTAEGLREDEARAMVRTWARSWFRSEGLRALWIVPRPVVDSILPLRITPEPDATVRVLVGRTELIAPQVEDEITKAVRERFAADDATREAATQRLARLDRFLEPHVRNVLAKAKDDVTRENANRLLAILTASRE